MSQDLAPKVSLQGSEITNCFVVMPFGRKSFRDGSARTYDFDKVYRIIIQRAIRQAGMQPIRADETIGSAIIHGAMFKDLRDQPVVLADLSLDNPNVFYELGIRHVMSSSGTVLICEEGSTLPFDVNLSRVIFYKYDGQSLDWEEVERMVEKLQVALQQARRGDPDSPVHALLETVFRDNKKSSLGEYAPAGGFALQKDLLKYQKLVADFWQKSDTKFEELYEEHITTAFGARALGYYCLDQQDTLPKQANMLAAKLGGYEQYDLAVILFAKLQEQGELGFHDILRYASVISELNPDLASANRAIEIAKQALPLIESEFENIPLSENIEALKAEALYYRSLDGLYQWKWQFTNNDDDLMLAINTATHAIKLMEQARTIGDYDYPGQIALAHLRVMLQLRIRDNDRKRIDIEGHRDSILTIKPSGNDNKKSISYLNWYQTITLADSGEEKAAREKAIANYGNDAVLMRERGNEEIGKLQYVQIRRLIEQYSPVLRNPSIVGSISQILQVGHKQ
ncbi:hypothetical protein GO755_02620 [Spirosoma sp. HMF4905]|uniref:DUF4071 domain-containing protein n=1 Tax=Spirosoma arboris TaxID=2682092 RepID=A0A7K1S505_9BACT|nr:hypothetical protein [Spirosoma arboris]MVM28911.1 hypothetical protein [Spirosoma arboris]